MGFRTARLVFLGTAVLGAVATLVSLLRASPGDRDVALFRAVAAGAVAGPLLPVFAMGQLIPGEARGRTVLTVFAGGLGGAAALGLAGRGDFLLTLLGLFAGFFVLVPLYLFVIAWVTLALVRADTPMLTGARNAVLLAAVLGMFSWAIPAGHLLNSWDVARAKSFVERLAHAVEEEKARTGRYPPPEDIRSIARGVGSLPVLLEGDLGYYAGEDHFGFEFQDRTAMFGGYEFHGKSRRWSHWVD